MKIWIAAAALLFMASTATADHLIYEGTEGIGKGKHIVFIANDHEYRSEQTCPLLAKILAKHHGFKCTVLFGLDENKCIKAGATDTPGMEALKDADMLFFFTRFMKLPDDQIQHLVNYFERGGPAVGVRTSTHCFNGQQGTWEKLNFNYGGEDYRGGMGEQVFGNTWNRERGQSHYGSNHQMGCTLTADPAATDHLILSGVNPIHAYSGAYLSQPPADASPLLRVQVLNTFHSSDDVNKDKPIVNAGWTRESYVAPSGDKKNARIVYTSFGASEDLLDEDGRRFMLNACLWAAGMEDKIKPNLDVSIVGEFSPSAYTNGLYYEGVKPTDLAGWDSRIMPASANLKGIDNPKFMKRSKAILKNRPGLRKELETKHPDLFGEKDQPTAKLEKQE
ncbi:MAG: hypothetical protein ACI87E_003107 [Mariniblastus sp.]|jgi:hypothetical protein